MPLVNKSSLHLGGPMGLYAQNDNHTEFYDLPKHSLHQCKRCSYQASLTAGTVMHKTRTPLLKRFWTIFLVIMDKRELSPLDISYKIGVAYKKAWNILHKINITMGSRDFAY